MVTNREETALILGVELGCLEESSQVISWNERGSVKGSETADTMRAITLHLGLDLLVQTDPPR